VGTIVDLFKEKVKQNRQLHKQREKLFILILEEEDMNNVIPIIEEYTHSILVLKGDQSCSLSEIYSHAKVTFTNSGMVDQDVRILFESKGTDKLSIPICYKNPMTILVAYSPNVEPFVLNDSILNRIHNSQIFLPYSLFHSEHYLYPLFIPKEEIFSYMYKPQKKRIAVLLDWFFGHGDVVAVYSQIKQFIQNQKGKYTIDIITRGAPLTLLEDLFPECKVYVHFDSFFVYETIAKCALYEDVYFLNTRLDSPPHLHLIDIVSKSLRLEQSVSHLVKEIDVPPLPKSILANLQHFKQSSSPLIGIQFNTKDQNRCWNQENIKEFITLCQQDNLTLINLTPQKGIPDNVVDLSSLSISQLFEVIKNLDIVVGIDSVCGHIAGVLGTASLTIWGGGTPLANAANPYVSYRSVSSNYSVYTESGDCKKISGSLIFQRMKQILNKEIKLNSKRITVQQTKKGAWIEKVGDSLE
jgi:Glycosyltransferase family 9 (heptosyltransferase)